MDATDLPRRARRAYELGRLFRAAPLAIPAVAAVLVALLLGRDAAEVCAIGLALAAVAVLSGWRGQGWGRAVMPSFAAGVAPLVLPGLVRSFGHVCAGGVCWSVCLVACAGAGMAAGALVGLRAARDDHPAQHLVAGLAITALTGAMGCAVAGASGVLGLVAALVLAAPPAYVLRRS